MPQGKTFKRPLQKKGGKALDSMFTAKGLGEVGKIYRERLGGPFYPVVPNKPVTKCGIGSCDYTFDPNTGEARGQCQGACCY